MSRSQHRARTKRVVLKNKTTYVAAAHRISNCSNAVVEKSGCAHTCEGCLNWQCLRSGQDTVLDQAKSQPPIHLDPFADGVLVMLSRCRDVEMQHVHFDAMYTVSPAAFLLTWYVLSRDRCRCGIHGSKSALALTWLGWNRVWSCMRYMHQSPKCTQAHTAVFQNGDMFQLPVSVPQHIPVHAKS